MARKEESSIAQEHYDAHEASFRKTKHYIRTAIVWTLFSLAGIITVVWVYHLVMPDDIRWLDDQRLLELKSIIIGAILGTVSSIVSRKVFAE